MVARPKVVTLSEREQSVLLLIAEGFSDRDIGKELNLSEDQVSYAARSVVNKMGARSRAHAAAWGVSLEIIELSADASELTIILE